MNTFMPMEIDYYGAIIKFENKSYHVIDYPMNVESYKVNQFVKSYSMKGKIRYNLDKYVYIYWEDDIEVMDLMLIEYKIKNTNIGQRWLYSMGSHLDTGFLQRYIGDNFNQTEGINDLEEVANWKGYMTIPELFEYKNVGLYTQNKNINNLDNVMFSIKNAPSNSHSGSKYNAREYLKLSSTGKIISELGLLK